MGRHRGSYRHCAAFHHSHHHHCHVLQTVQGQLLGGEVLCRHQTGSSSTHRCSLLQNGKTAKINRYNVWIPVASCALIYLLGISPIYIIIAAGVLGWLYGKMRKVKSRKVKSKRAFLLLKVKYKTMLFLKLFIIFTKIGTFNFGGGYAMLSLIHNETVVKTNGSAMLSLLTS